MLFTKFAFLCGRHRQPPARLLLLHVVVRGGHSNRCRGGHYLFSWTSDEITGPSIGGDTPGVFHAVKRRIPSGEFGTRICVSVLTSSQDPLPDIGNIQSDNLSRSKGQDSFGKGRNLLTAPIAPKSWTSRVSRRAHAVGMI